MDGLSRTASPEYVEALGLDGAQIRGQAERLSLLRRLREGAGVHVKTGPEGAAWWLPVSVEVRVDLVPDDVEMHDRCEPGMEWALRAVGVTATRARGLVRHYGDKGPTKVARIYATWQDAVALLAAYNEPHTEPGAIIVEAFAVEAVTDPAEALLLLDRVENAALDYEWDIEGVHAPLFTPEGLGIATAGRTYYIPLICSDFVSPLLLDGGEQIRRRVMATIMRTPTVWHNAKADLGAQWLGDPLDAWGAPLHDTLVLAFIDGENELGLKHLARKYLKRDPLEFPGTMRALPLETCRRYGGTDARNTYDLVPVLWRIAQEREQLDIYEKIERPIIPLLTSMERYGHPMDMQAAMTFRDQLLEDEERIRARFIAEDGLDISDDKQTRELVKRRTGYDPGGVSVDVLSKVVGEWMDAIMRYRKVRHRRRAFLERHISKWEAAGRPNEWRAYTSLNQAGSADQHDARSFKKAPRSGRLSSSSPERIPPSGLPGAPSGNLQNQPNEGADGGFMEGVPGAKPIFVAPAGQVVWAKDYSQLEMRIAASLSGDPAFLAAVNGGDPHSDFQRRILELSGKQIPRVGAKQGNFMSLYGGRADMLRLILAKLRVHLPDEDTELIVKSHEAAYPGLYLFDQQVIDYARVTGYSATAFGRRRYDDDINSTEPRARGHAERALVNHAKGQGTAADLLKLAMGLVVPVLKQYGAHMTLQIHDELVGYCDADVVEPFLAAVDQATSVLQLPNVTLSMSGGYGKTWADAH